MKKQYNTLNVMIFKIILVIGIGIVTCFEQSLVNSSSKVLLASTTDASNNFSPNDFKVNKEKKNHRLLIYIGAGTAAFVFILFVVIFMITQRRKLKQIKRIQIADKFLRKNKGYVYKEPLFPGEDNKELNNKNLQRVSTLPNYLSGSYEVVGVMERKHVPCIEKYNYLPSNSIFYLRNEVSVQNSSNKIVN
ncbi:uncharacterized protein LOC105846694 [Hydra vulgaris]|uniref:uncharacterized protein LOC105846694 n=1 Tax=Hydra vulgaris TaxID=6087 RepID=UPI001F5E5B04|nr:uncharacterized protein LOC105846694 [Hydra vulgaris]XP_047122351.1 uncharacterized protein LOC105846694 [Hydra vulgaris]XP_047122352.1 uncharacterized protein LOC105846694 [Hydra vulgaris]XP_047122353.1 uncharacterized protein LOC105846694 [Hydra vulgaris]